MILLKSFPVQVILIVLALVFNVSSAFSQSQFDSRSKPGFITGADFKKSGLRLFNGGKKDNSRWIRIDYKDSVKTYTPHDLSGYGFENGKKYQSMSVLIAGEEKRVFLEQLAKGELSLYYYPGMQGKIFYIQKGTGILIPLTREGNAANAGFKSQLAVITGDCENFNRLIRTSNYSRGSLAMLISRHNDNCNTKYFPFIKYGVFAGFGMARLKANTSNADYILFYGLNFEPEQRFTVGAFLNYPFWPLNYSFYSEIYFEQSSFYSEQSQNGEPVIISIDYKAINLPLMVRYTIPGRSIRPFVNGGLMYTLNVDIEKSTIQRPQSGTLGEQDIWAIQQYCLVAGTGSEIAIGSRNAISLECRYVWGIPAQRTKLFRNEWKVITSFNF
jgi:hypothetical protein